MSLENDLRIAREEVDRMWIAEGHDQQHDSLCIAVKYLMSVVEQQARTIQRLDDEADMTTLVVGRG